ncbi:alkene reductase [Bradyrhizobium sp. 1]|uniref:alkene reductase n=1 Tax=Bradyrhizobium sp. 1 TaxID=241591 RepID=UPI001FF89132|nr:alkene reductase [Bradyrhizobium sp. 1]MCK1394426.1 alkene reductase [Bradyrhizobium sp. 1]
MKSGDPLFSPFRLGDRELANRIVLAPLTRSRAVGEGLPVDLHAEYYAQRASAGLLIAEATQISSEGQGYPSTPGIYTNEQISAWRVVTDRVHSTGGTIFLQLWHVGRAGHPANRPGAERSVAPSALAAPGNVYTKGGLQPFPIPRELSTSDIPRIVEDYVSAANKAMAAGFDGVEIHGANGYLVDQFLQSSSNHRSDQYGGSIENRVRFLHLVTEAVSRAIGRSRTGVRLSPFGIFNGASDPDPSKLFDVAIRGLSEIKIGYLHVINPEVSGDSSAAGVGVDVAGFARQRFAGPLIVAGGYDRDRAIEAVSSGAADLVAFGRLFISNPDLPRRLRLGAPLVEPDRSTFYTSGPRGYVDYPPMATDQAR